MAPQLSGEGGIDQSRQPGRSGPPGERRVLNGMPEPDVARAGGRGGAEAAEGCGLRANLGPG